MKAHVRQNLPFPKLCTASYRQLLHTWATLLQHHQFVWNVVTHALKSAYIFFGDLSGKTLVGKLQFCSATLRLRELLREIRFRLLHVIWKTLDLGCGVGGFWVESHILVRFRMSNWNIFHIVLPNWGFRWKRYNFFWNFCWNRFLAVHHNFDWF